MRSAPRLRLLAALSAAGMVLTACGSQRQMTFEPLPGPSAPAPQPQPRPQPAGADAAACQDAAELYLSVTLLPLHGQREASAPAADEQEAAPEPGDVPLTDAATSLRRATPRLPAELRQPFRDTADVLDRSGAHLQPSELAEVRDALRPVDDWLSRRCDR